MVAKQKVSDDQLLELFKAGVAPKLIIEEFDIALSTIHKKKKELADKYGIRFPNIQGLHGRSRVLTIDDVKTGRYKTLTDKIKVVRTQQEQAELYKQNLIQRLYRVLTAQGTTIINGNEFKLGEVTLSGDKITISLAQDN